MTTEVLTPVDGALDKAAALIRAGEVVAFPTETVYGLGANATDERAIAKIFEAKGRPGDNPLIVHISELSDISAIIRGDMPAVARALADAYWPGPLTMIFEKGDRIPLRATAGLDSVAVRLPSHPAARELIARAGLPIAAPSANLSGRPSPTTAEHVLNDMNGRISLILDGGACEVGLESTVIDVRQTPVRVLRPGGVTPGMIADIAGEAEVDGCVLRPLRDGETAYSPGTKYRHYAPNGALVVVKGAALNVAREICCLYDSTPGDKRILALNKHIPLYADRRVYPLGEDARDVAEHLFAALRLMDDEGVRAIFSEAVPAEGIGLAVMNRLGRAAAFHIVDAGEG